MINRRIWNQQHPSKCGQNGQLLDFCNVTEQKFDYVVVRYSLLCVIMCLFFCSFLGIFFILCFSICSRYWGSIVQFDPIPHTYVYCQSQAQRSFSVMFILNFILDVTALLIFLSELNLLLNED